MAREVRLIHEASGLRKKGYYGFSWTTFCFGCFPALFRGDWVTFLAGFAVLFVLGLMTTGIGVIIAGVAWAFMYNGYYTRKLIERGYRLADTDVVNDEARRKLNIAA